MASGSGFRSGLGLLLLRLLVGWVFLSEGNSEIPFPEAQGWGRFAKIGIPFPHITGPFVGVVEIVCGAMLILGIATLYAVVPLLITIGVAIATTKVPLLHKQDSGRPCMRPHGLLHVARADCDCVSWRGQDLFDRRR